MKAKHNEIRAIVRSFQPDAYGIVITEDHGFLIVNWPTSMLVCDKHGEIQRRVKEVTGMRAMVT